MNVLLVGAGSVGKVYGRYLYLGGASVSFLTKEKHAQAARSGFDFYILNDRKRRHKPQHFKDFSVLTDLMEVRRQHWDYVILCMDSTGLKGTWLDDFLSAIQSAPVLSLQPGLKDREFLLTKIPENRLLSGTIPILSFETSLLENNSEKPGTAYWFPPGAKAAMSGNPALLQPLFDCFQKGNFAVKWVASVAHENKIVAPVLTVLVQALKNCEWSFSALARGDSLKIATSAMVEAVHANAKKLKMKSPFTGYLKPYFFKALMKIAPKLVPFHLERYLQVHFTKVADQMSESLQDYEELADFYQLPNHFLKKLSSVV